MRVTMVAAGIGVIALPAFPDAHHVAQQAPRHEGIDAALVLEEQINEGFALAEGHRVEQIAVPLGKLLIDITTRLNSQLIEVQLVHQRHWQE